VIDEEKEYKNLFNLEKCKIRAIIINYIKEIKRANPKTVVL